MSKFEGNAVTWFEIPTADIERATKFYETLLAAKMLPFPGDEPCNMFPSGEGAVGGCLVQRLEQKPSDRGNDGVSSMSMASWTTRSSGRRS